MSQAVFAWEGFSFSHPEDWSPVSLNGTRAQGYARLQSSGRIGCQVRWQRAPKKPDLDAALDNYLRLLERDASKAKLKLRTERELSRDLLLYRWVGSTQGRGAIFLSPDGRLFILEVVGGKNDSLLPPSKSLLDSFQSDQSDDLERWSLFGLSVKLPQGLSPATKTLQSGRTWLTFRPRGAVLEAGRYAFGAELVAKHGLEPWARAALGMPSAIAEEEPNRLKLSVSSLPWRRGMTALVGLDEAHNQLVIVRSTSKGSKWKPAWDWLDFNDS